MSHKKTRTATPTPLSYLLVELLILLAIILSIGWFYLNYLQPGTDSSASTSAIPPVAQTDNTPLEWEPPPSLPEFDEYAVPPPQLRPIPEPHVADLLDSVYEQVQTTYLYDPSYVKISYPMGDVSPELGVCTDVVIRAFRSQGADLQQLVHEDMRNAFRRYPQKWGLKRPDANIDHRRVLNLMTFFKRMGVALNISDHPDDYQPGDVVAWQLNEKQYHIGIVLKARSYDEQRPLIGHNIDSGARIEDVLFAWPIVGHYRYFLPELPPRPELQAGLTTDPVN